MKIRNLATMGAFALLLASGMAGAHASPGQSVEDLTDSLTAEDLVTALIGDSTDVTNVEYTGSPLAAGSFSGFEDAGIDAGIVLSTGCAEGSEDASCSSSILGPNESPNTGVILGEAGDADLDNLLDGVNTQDAAVLEFDFVPDAEAVTFTYVFGSEEYPDFVDAGYNDVFAFYVNGTNYATIDGEDGETPVAIDTINEETNSDYFRKNYVTDPQIDIELNGITTLLTFTAPVNEGESNHIKLAIADSGDGVYDSAVLIEAGSFRANNPPEADDQTVQTYENTPVDITLTGSDPDDDDLTFDVTSDPEDGSLSGDGDTWTFTPDEDFVGETEFTFVADDGSLTSEEATVTIEVLPLTEVADLGNVTVEQAECVEGEIVGPEITLPDVDGVSYDVDGDVAPGEEVTVVATAEEGHTFAAEIDGWDVNEDGQSAQQQVTLDAAPTCEPPETGGGDDGDDDGDDNTGGGADDDPTPTEPPSGQPLPETGQSSVSSSVIAALALVFAGSLALFAVKRRKRLG